MDCDSIKYARIKSFFGYCGLYIISMTTIHHIFMWKYDEYEASIAINTLGMLEGDLPSRVLGYVIEWVSIYKQELMNNWNMIQSAGKYLKIPPLV